MASDNETAADYWRRYAEANAWTAWDWLRAATEAGWQDPGLSEPLDVTVQRARDFLARAPHG